MTKELARTLTVALVSYLDENRPKGTMDCSSGECVSLEKALTEENFDSVETLIKKKLSRLSEFEQAVGLVFTDAQLIPRDKDGIANIHDIDEFIKKKAAELLTLAKKELQPDIDVEIEQAYKTQDDMVFRKGWEQGRTDALRDLPRWIRDDSIKAEQYITVGKNGARFHYKGHSLLISDLTKLPGFNEEG